MVVNSQESMLKQIMNEISKIKNEIYDIKNELKEIREGTLKMSNHIDFVDGVYDKVKSPFHYILDSVDKVRGNVSTETIEKEEPKPIVDCDSMDIV